MQCSAAMDILFLMDGSYSVGKGSFERSKHYAIKLCQALDIGPDKVCVCAGFFLVSSSHLSQQLMWLDPRSGASRADSVWLHPSTGVRSGPAQHQTRADETHEEDLLQVCFSVSDPSLCTGCTTVMIISPLYHCSSSIGWN